MNAGSGKPALTARIGIETGSVVVDAAGEIYGDAPNTAARMQGLADGILVTSRFNARFPGHIEVQRQITGLFVAEERGSHELKGVPEPVTLFRLIRASGGGRRAGQRHLHEVSRLCCSCRARLVASTGRPYEAVAVASMLGQKEARLFVFRSRPRR